MSDAATPRASELADAEAQGRPPGPGSAAAGAARRDPPGPDAEVVIRTRGLRSAFESHVVHDGLDLEVRKGEVFGLVGGSGAGKSVLLNTLIGLKEPDGGDVEQLGRRVTSAVVQALFSIILIDAAFALLYMQLNL